MPFLHWFEFHLSRTVGQQELNLTVPNGLVMRVVFQNVSYVVWSRAVLLLVGVKVSSLVCYVVKRVSCQKPVRQVLLLVFTSNDL